jgi:hypothetical protein
VKTTWKCADGKQFCFPFFQPAFSIAGVAFGTASVFAGMIRVLLMAAHFAFGQVSAHAFRSAGEYVGKCPFVAWQNPLAEFIQVLSACLAIMSASSIMTTDRPSDD